MSDINNISAISSLFSKIRYFFMVLKQKKSDLKCVARLINHFNTYPVA